MTTTGILTPEQQQDNFTLNFLIWLSKNYLKTGDDEYRHLLDKVTPEKDITFLSGEECLAIYHSQHIPSLPSPDPKIGPDAMTVLEETARRNRVLFSGFQKIVHYLATSSVFNKHDINNIIADTMDHIS